MLLIIFASIELIFFIANIHKFPDGGYITIIISLGYIFVMYTVYFGRKISNRFTKFVDLGKYVNQINELSEDTEIQRQPPILFILQKLIIVMKLKKK